MKSKSELLSCLFNKARLVVWIWSVEVWSPEEGWNVSGMLLHYSWCENELE